MKLDMGFIQENVFHFMAVKKLTRGKSVGHFPDTDNGAIHIHCLNGDLIAMYNRRRWIRTAIVPLDRSSSNDTGAIMGDKTTAVGKAGVVYIDQFDK